jgi:hypothetical protein
MKILLIVNRRVRSSTGGFRRLGKDKNIGCVMWCFLPVVSDNHPGLIQNILLGQRGWVNLVFRIFCPQPSKNMLIHDK